MHTIECWYFILWHYSSNWRDCYSRNIFAGDHTMVHCWCGELMPGSLYVKYGLCSWYFIIIYYNLQQSYPMWFTFNVANTSFFMMFTQKNRLQKKPSLGRSRVKSSVVKLILMIIHYLLVGFYTLTAVNITLKNFPAHEEMLSNHFLCEALGDRDVQCSREGFGQLQQDSFIQIFVYNWFNIYPSIFLIFIINRTCCKKKLYTASTSAASHNDRWLFIHCHCDKLFYT